MRNAKATVLIAGLALASCSSIAPVKIAAGDQCVRCRRTIQDTRLAGELVYTGGLVEKFRAPGCMAKYLATYPATSATVYVTDYSSGNFVKASEALYVPVMIDPDRGEGDYRAYKIKTEADRAALEGKTAPVDWKTVLERARG